MSNYCRFYGTGMPIFLTFVTHKRKPLLVKNIELLRSSINKVKNKFPFKLNAFVVLPDHLHMIISLPNSDDDFSKRTLPAMESEAEAGSPRLG